MSRGFLRITTVASVIALAFAAPSAASAKTATPCAKQTRTVASAKKAVTKAQKAKAATPAARKQRAKRVKAAKAKHTRAKKTLASCKAKAKAKPAPAPAPAPVPVPLPEPVPVPPVLSVAATTVGALEGFAVTVAAPAQPAGMVYRLAFRSRGTLSSTCSFLAILDNVSASVNVLMQTKRPWCPGPGRVSLFQAVQGSKPLPTLGTEIAGIDVVVNP
jgi:hypothetical protein